MSADEIKPNISQYEKSAKEWKNKTYFWPFDENLVDELTFPDVSKPLNISISAFSLYRRGSNFVFALT